MAARIGSEEEEREEEEVDEEGVVLEEDMPEEARQVGREED